MSKVMTERQEKLFAAVQAICVDQLGVREEKVTMDAKFVEDLGCDSLDTVELVLEVEYRFDVEIGDEQAELFTTVRDVVTWLDENGATL